VATGGNVLLDFGVLSRRCHHIYVLQENMPAPKTRDVFAEYYVAGLFADAGWDIYSPHRDRGFDLIVAKNVSEEMVILPVQVKGLYRV
jgi:hypothetical protein